MSTETKELSLEELKGVVGDVVIEKTKTIEDEMKKMKDEIKAQKVNKEEEDPESSKKFVKDLMQGNFKELESKAIDTTTGSFGYAVPTRLANKVIEKKDKIAKMRKLASIVQMAGKYDNPTEGTSVTAYHVGENTDITESNPTVGKKSLDDWYMGTQVKIPYKLLDTSAINIEEYIGGVSARALSSLEETDFVAGDGSEKPKGFRQESVGTVYMDSTALAYNDLVELFYELKEQYRNNCVFITSTAGLKLIKQIKDDNKNPIFDVRDQTLFNKPLIETEDIPSNLGTTANETEIWCVDPSYYLIKDGVNMIAEKDKVIEKMQLKIVLHQAVDGCVTNADAFKLLTGVK